MDIKDIKIIFIDIDGTLFNDNHSLTTYNRQVCIDAQQAGVIVVLNTGRITSNAIKVARQIACDRFNGYVIANNGSHIYSFADQKLIFKDNIPNELAKKVFRWIDNNKMKCQLYSESGSFVNRQGKNSRYWADVMEAEYTILNHEDDLIHDVARIIVVNKTVTNEKTSQTFMQEVQNKFPQLGIKTYRLGVYEITQPQISKGYAVTYLCEKLGIKPEQAMAFGDSYNDQWLMNAVGYPVAMGNAISLVKELANYICQTNNENGVGNTIAELVLKVSAQ